jgi:phage shock protein A
MVESIFVRVQNVLSSGADTAVSFAEKVSGTSLMREAIRQVERAEDDSVDALHMAKVRRAQAERQEQMLKERAATLDEQARFAITKGRDDLAQAAIARQIECEAQTGQARAAQEEAAAETVRLEECLAALKLRKEQMRKELAAFEAARRTTVPGGTSAADRAERKADRAETLFERSMAAVGGSDLGLMGAEEAAKIAEVEALRKEDTIAARLAAMRDAIASGVSAKRKPKGR